MSTRSRPKDSPRSGGTNKSSPPNPSCSPSSTNPTGDRHSRKQASYPTYTGLARSLLDGMVLIAHTIWTGACRQHSLPECSRIWRIGWLPCRFIRHVMGCRHNLGIPEPWMRPGIPQGGSGGSWWPWPRPRPFFNHGIITSLPPSVPGLAWPLLPAHPMYVSAAGQRPMEARQVPGTIRSSAPQPASQPASEVASQPGLGLASQSGPHQCGQACQPGPALAPGTVAR